MGHCMDAQPRAFALNPTVLPILVCVTALAIAALVLGLIATGLAGTGGSGSPAWSGAHAPPGAVGLGPEHAALNGR
jgi:hypothetical protein